MIRHRRGPQITKENMPAGGQDGEPPSFHDGSRGAPKLVGGPLNAKMCEIDTSSSKPSLLRLQEQRQVLVQLLQYLILLGPWAFLSWGGVLWCTKLSTHDECDMTWMQPNYERIHEADALLNHPHYSLYRYQDSRDPRPSKEQRRDGRHIEKSTGTATASALLFVPGHAGSYQQVRSLGAHAIRLTRRNIPAHQERQVQQSLLLLSSDHNQNGTHDAQDKSVSWWWDGVYSLDLREEPTGLHGRFVEEQAEFIGRAVRYLQDSLRYADVAIVAHSLGGYSSMLALARDDRHHLTSYRTLLTFATPHLHPVLSWDWTLRSTHREIARWFASRRELDDQNDLVLVSVSGGLRDEIIPPRSCRAVTSATAPKNPAQPSVFTWMATDLLKTPIDPGKLPAHLGMDHRAIVWCHNLLEPMLDVVLAGLRRRRDGAPGAHNDRLRRLIEHWDNADRSSRPGATDDRWDYDAAVRNQYVRLRTSFGTWQATALEASALYNAEWIISLYSAVSLVHWCFLPSLGLTTLVAAPLATSAIAWTVSTANYLSFPNLCVLSGAAHSVFCGTRALLLLLGYDGSRGTSVSAPHLPPRRSSSMMVLAHVPVVASVLGRAAAADSLFGRHGSGSSSSRLAGTLEVVMAAACLVGTYALAIYLAAAALFHVSSDEEYCRRRRYRFLVLIAWLLPVLPFLVAGEVAFAVRRRCMSGTFWLIMQPLVLWLTLHYHHHCVVSAPPYPPLPAAASKSPWTHRAHTSLRILLAVLCICRLFRTLWTNEYDDSGGGEEYAFGGAPLVYQVLALVLGLGSSVETAAALLWRMMYLDEDDDVRTRNSMVP